MLITVAERIVESAIAPTATEQIRVAHLIRWFAVGVRHANISAEMPIRVAGDPARAFTVPAAGTLRRRRRGRRFSRTPRIVGQYTHELLVVIVLVVGP